MIPLVSNSSYFDSQSRPTIQALPVFKDAQEAMIISQGGGASLPSTTADLMSKPTLEGNQKPKNRKVCAKLIQWNATYVEDLKEAMKVARTRRVSSVYREAAEILGRKWGFPVKPTAIRQKWARINLSSNLKITTNHVKWKTTDEEILLQIADEQTAKQDPAREKIAKAAEKLGRTISSCAEKLKRLKKMSITRPAESYQSMGVQGSLHQDTMIVQMPPPQLPSTSQNSTLQTSPIDMLPMQQPSRRFWTSEEQVKLLEIVQGTKKRKEGLIEAAKQLDRSFHMCDKRHRLLETLKKTNIQVDQVNKPWTSEEEQQLIEIVACAGNKTEGLVEATKALGRRLSNCQYRYEQIRKSKAIKTKWISRKRWKTDDQEKLVKIVDSSKTILEGFEIAAAEFEGRSVVGCLRKYNQIKSKKVNKSAKQTLEVSTPSIADTQNVISTTILSSSTTPSQTTSEGVAMQDLPNKIPIQRQLGKRKTLHTAKELEAASSLELLCSKYVRLDKSSSNFT